MPDRVRHDSIGNFCGCRKHCRNAISKQLLVTILILMSALILSTTPSAGEQQPAIEAAVPETVSKDSSAEKPPLPWLDQVDTRSSGRLKTTASVSWPDADSIFEPVGTGTQYNGSVDLRLINETFFSDNFFFEAHYEAILTGGDTRRKLSELATTFPGLSDNLFLGARLDDDRRLMDLTDTLRDRDSYRLLHRLDRLNLGTTTAWGTLRLGRQAITWGNGLIFNPMDLFNPFAPTEVDRDYKAGDDLISAQIYLPNGSEMQLLGCGAPQSGYPRCVRQRILVCRQMALPRRHDRIRHHGSPSLRRLCCWDGSRGYLADAAWRLDATWTLLDDPAPGSPGGYLSMIANLDYSWVWWDKNFYGLLEFYFNGLGDNDYEEAITNPDIGERLERGELFVLGRTI